MTCSGQTACRLGKPTISDGYNHGRAICLEPTAQLVFEGVYPFHPPGKPDQLRTRHLAGLKTPTLIVQGTRDVFGARKEVSAYALSPAIEILWLEDGDHDLKPRKRISGLSSANHLKALAEAVSIWAERITS